MTASLRTWRHVVVLALSAASLLGVVRLALNHGSFHTFHVSRVEHQVDWQAFGGAWQFAGGVMSNDSDERGAKLMNGSTHWQNYLVEADVLLRGAYGFAGLVIRSNDEEEGVDAYHGYTVGLSDLDNSLFLGRADYGWRGFLTKTVIPRVFERKWYHLKILAFGCTLAVSATTPTGLTTSASVRDPECIQSGRFGLKSYNTGAEWRNIQVRSVTHQDLISMIGDRVSPAAVPESLLGKAESSTDIRAFEPLHRDLAEHRASLDAQSISSLRLLSPGVPQPVTVHGIVTLTRPVLFIQDGTGGLAIAADPETPPLEIGDEVEARGQAELHDFSSVLRNATVRMLWSHAPVPPVSITASQAATGAFDAQYIDIQGRLVGKRTDSKGTTVLTLDEGSQSFLAVASQRSTTDSLKLMSRLRLRGVCVVDSIYTRELTPFAVLLPSLVAVDLVENPPWWSVRHIVMLIIGSLIALLVLLVTYIFIERWRLQAVLEERQRLAHEMHDTLAQSFAGIGFQLEAISHDTAETCGILPQLDTARAMVRNSHEEARRSIAALRPESLQSLGLLCALEACALRMIGASPSIRVRTHNPGGERPLPLRIADTLLRIGYEAIANAVLHGNPTVITLSLIYSSTGLELIVQDNGVGFTVPADPVGFGIRGMRKRADSISARCSIRSTPGSGTEVHTFVPLSPSFLRTCWKRTVDQVCEWRLYEPSNS